MELCRKYISRQIHAETWTSRMTNDIAISIWGFLKNNHIHSLNVVISKISESKQTDLGTFCSNIYRTIKLLLALAIWKLVVVAVVACSCRMWDYNGSTRMTTKIWCGSAWHFFFNTFCLIVKNPRMSSIIATALEVGRHIGRFQMIFLPSSKKYTFAAKKRNMHCVSSSLLQLQQNQASNADWRPQ